MRKFILIVVLLLAACGGAEEATRGGGSLSVLAPELFSAVIAQAAADLPFDLELSTYTPDEREHTIARMRPQLMAGQGYDLFFWDGHPLGIHLDSGLFADFNKLIDNRDDFYANILEAWEYRGGLYIFPLSVEFMYVGISSNMPQHLIERFSEKSTVSSRELMQIYLEAPEGLKTFGAWTHIQNTMAEFIDMENRSSTLDDARFIEYLEYLRRASEADIEVDLSEIFVWGGYDVWMPVLAEHFAFLSRTVNSRWTGREPISVLFNAPEPAFINFIPLADDEGRLIIRQNNFYHWNEFSGNWDHSMAPFWGSVVISAAGEKELAWQFVQALMSAMVSHGERHAGQGRLFEYRMYFGSNNLISPIKREYLRPLLNPFFYRNFEDILTTDSNMRRFYGLSLFPEERSLEVQAAIDKLEAYNNMPVVLATYLPGSLYEDVIEELLLGKIIAEQAAVVINNRVALWLIE